MKSSNISSDYRIPWLNFSSAYLDSAKSLLEHCVTRPVTIIPFLFLLRHSLELSLKSIFISHNKQFDYEHNLSILYREATKHLELESKESKDKWEEIGLIINNFNETKYGQERFFNKNDLNSDLLRYLQVDDFDSYKKLNKIDTNKLVKEAQQVRSWCELLTLKVSMEWGQ